MPRLTRRSLVLGLAVSSVALPLIGAAPGQAQGGIPDGVFVRESNGTVWLTLKGQRVAVPLWPTTDADIAAIPTSDMWAVLSVSDSGAVVAGGKPAWLVDAPSPTATSALPLAPSADGALVISEHLAYTSRFAPSTVYIVGLVENKGQSAAGVKTIAVSLLGAAGETVGGGSAVYKPSFLDSGTRAGWLAVVSNAPSHSQIRVQLESGPAQSSFGQPISHQLRVDGATVQRGSTSARAKVAGQVVNVGDRETGRATLIVAVFSAQGALLDVNQATSTLEALSPGQSSPFDVTFISDAAQAPARAEVYAEARLK